MELNKGNYLTTQKVWTPTDLALNAAAYISGGSTAFSPLVPMVGVYALNLIGTSVTGGGKLQARVMDFDGATVLATYDLVTAIAAGVPFVYHMALEQTPTVVGGTIGTALFLPQYGLQFGFTNTNATAGTFTARAFLALY